MKKIKSFFKILRKFLFSVIWYEAVNSKKITKKNYRLVVLKSKKNFLRFSKKNYFSIKKYKLKRFSKKIYLLLLVKRKKILSSGWIFYGKKWKITEIDVSVNLNKTLLLFDFETPQSLRNKGYYTMLLKLIKNRFIEKRLAIYTLSYNLKSRRGIEKAGYKFIKKIYA